MNISLSLSLALFLLACSFTDSPMDDDKVQKQFHAETTLQIDPRKIAYCKQMERRVANMNSNEHSLCHAIFKKRSVFFLRLPFLKTGYIDQACALCWT
jgi:hypothetical protein